MGRKCGTFAPLDMCPAGIHDRGYLSPVPEPNSKLRQTPTITLLNNPTQPYLQTVIRTPRMGQMLATEWDRRPAEGGGKRPVTTELSHLPRDADVIDDVTVMASLCRSRLVQFFRRHTRAGQLAPQSRTCQVVTSAFHNAPDGRGLIVVRRSVGPP